MFHASYSQLYSCVDKKKIAVLFMGEDLKEKKNSLTE